MLHAYYFSKGLMCSTQTVADSFFIGTHQSLWKMMHAQHLETCPLQSLLFIFKNQVTCIFGNQATFLVSAPCENRSTTIRMNHFLFKVMTRMENCVDTDLLPSSFINNNRHSSRLREVDEASEESRCACWWLTVTSKLIKNRMVLAFNPL